MMFGEMKLRSKRLIAEAEPKPINVAMVYIGLLLLVSFLSAKLFGGMTEEQFSQYFQHVADGNIEYALEYLKRILPTPSTVAMIMVLQLTLRIVSVGYTMFLMNTVRNTGACFGNLLDGFGFFLKIIVKEILVSVVMALGVMLFIVPGIILAYAYRQSTYIMIDNPDYSVIRCMRESRMLMRGHKGELFALDMSFLGWMLLMLLPLLGYFVMLFVQPFTGLTYAQYFDRLIGRAETTVEE